MACCSKLRSPIHKLLIINLFVASFRLTFLLVGIFFFSLFKPSPVGAQILRGRFFSKSFKDIHGLEQENIFAKKKKKKSRRGKFIKLDICNYIQQASSSPYSSVTTAAGVSSLPILFLTPKFSQKALRSLIRPNHVQPARRKDWLLR